MDSQKEIANELQQDLNKMNSIQDEFIAEVFLEMEITDDGDWRINSGLLTGRNPGVSEITTDRIWKKSAYRLFLSHKSSSKVETSKVKESLEPFGISCFVAHEDIAPTKAWQNEIEAALRTMDGFVALMSKDFHESDWTDQEVGFAFGRGVPIIAVRLGTNPYGFIGKLQGLSGSWEDAPLGIAKILINQNKMFQAYLESLRGCSSWDSANILARALDGIQHMSNTQIRDLVTVYNQNIELHGSFAFRGSKPRLHGPGLVHIRNKFSETAFAFTSEGLIERNS